MAENRRVLRAGMCVAVADDAGKHDGGQSTAVARAGATALLDRARLPGGGRLAFRRFRLSWDYDMFADGSKARRFGFHQFVETEAMFFSLFDAFRRRRIIP